MSGLNTTSSKGIAAFAQNNPYTDYLRLAYLQALSVKLTQTHNQYAVFVDDPKAVPAKYREVFDHVIEIPWGDAAEHEEWKLSNEWKAIFCTPFDQTLKVDVDMLFFEDHLPWWGLYEEHDFVPALEVTGYKGEVSTADTYRKVFTSNDLPNVYSALMYFSKSDRMYDFFKLSGALFKHWDRYAVKYLDYNRPQHPTTDVVYAVAAKLLNIQSHNTYARFTHMKRDMQNVPTAELTENWMGHFRYYFSDRLELFVENFKQFHPFHYHIKEFATDELIARYERALGL